MSDACLLWCRSLKAFVQFCLLSLFCHCDVWVLLSRLALVFRWDLRSYLEWCVVPVCLSCRLTCPFLCLPVCLTCFNFHLFPAASKVNKWQGRQASKTDAKSAELEITWEVLCWMLSIEWQTVLESCNGIVKQFCGVDLAAMLYHDYRVCIKIIK